MTLRGRGPWLASAALHGGVLLLIVVFWTERPAPQALRMHFAAGGATSEPSRRAALAAPSRASAVAEPSLPEWRETRPSEAAPHTASAPASLDELLVDRVPQAAADTSVLEGLTGLGLKGPTLVPPPADLVGPEGGTWTLDIHVPAGGGFADGIEGLDSGHPELDRWLEKYLLELSFPSGPEGGEYTVSRTVRLHVVKPQ